MNSLIAALILLLVIALKAQAIDAVSEAEFGRVKSAYTNVLARISWERGPLKGRFGKTLSRSDVTIYETYPRCIYLIDGAIDLSLDAESLRLVGLSNVELDNVLKNGARQVAPTLTIDKAVTVAVGYLDKLGIDLPKHCSVAVAGFNHNYPSCWEIRWKLFANEFPFDEFVEPYAESVAVIFHETLGLKGFSQNVYSPLPKSLEIRIGRDEAIIKASKVAPAVTKSSFYKEARAPGFVVNGLKSCALKVAVPNWLLDPKRAVWIREKPPEETRLCWVITFTTADTRTYKPGEPRLIPPEIIIYIDAATGEVVGANFT